MRLWQYRSRFDFTNINVCDGGHVSVEVRVQKYKRRMSIFVTCSPPEYTNVADQRCENQRNLRRSRKNTPNPKSPVSAQRQSAFISQAILIDRRS